MPPNPSRLMRRIHALTAVHGKLDGAIRAEAVRPLPDGLRLQVLKRRRLRVKDRIARIAAWLNARSPAQALDAA